MSGHKRAKQKKFDRLFKIFRYVYLPQENVVRKLTQAHSDAKQAIAAQLGPLTELTNKLHQNFAANTNGVVASKTQFSYAELKRLISPKEPSTPGQLVMNAELINEGLLSLLNGYADVGMLMLVSHVIKMKSKTLRNLRALGD